MASEHANNSEKATDKELARLKHGEEIYAKQILQEEHRSLGATSQRTYWEITGPSTTQQQWGALPYPSTSPGAENNYRSIVLGVRVSYQRADSVL